MKREKGLENNHALYEAVFAANGVSYARTDAHWHSLVEGPPLYSNLVTRSRDWLPGDIFQQIDDRFHRKGWDEWSIKDSFAVLDLRAHGFVELFESQWLYLEQRAFQPIATPVQRVLRVTTPAQLQLWRTAWGEGEALADAIFSPSLLQNPKIAFVAGLDTSEQMISGALLNRSDDVIGISNCFCPEDMLLSHWSDVCHFIQREFGPIDIVGYESMETLMTLAPLGVTAEGPLKVWLKRK